MLPGKPVQFIDDVMWWKHFPHKRSSLGRNHPSLVGFWDSFEWSTSDVDLWSFPFVVSLNKLLKKKTLELSITGDAIMVTWRHSNALGYIHSGWTPFHPMCENSTSCTKWLVHQANAAAGFIVHQANVAGAFIVHQGNVVEHFRSYIK